MSEKDAINRFINFMRLKHWSLRTEESYVRWAQKYAAFLRERKPAGTSEQKVRAYLESIAPVSAAKTQGQALNALVVFYREGLGQPLGELGSWSRAKRPQRLPSWLDADEACRVVSLLTGEAALPCKLLFGSGLRLLEACRLRVMDVDLKNGALMIRGAKGAKDRIVPLPKSLREPIARHLTAVRALWEGDRAHDYPAIAMPTVGLEKKYPNAGKKWEWYWVFPSRTLSRDPRTGIYRRHHIHENSVQKALAVAAAKAGIAKRITCHGLRHSYASALVRAGTDVVKIQKLLGHTHLETTAVYLHAQPDAILGVKSPLDAASDKSGGAK